MMESLPSLHVGVALISGDHMFYSVVMEGGITIPQSVHQFLKYVAGSVTFSIALSAIHKTDNIKCIFLSMHH